MYNSELPMPHFTPREAARIIGIADKVIYAWHKQGRIRFTLDCTNAYRVPYGEVYRVLHERDGI